MAPQLETIALLYLAFAHATDGSLSGEEMRAVAQRIRAWQPDASLDEIGGLIKDTAMRYKAMGDLATRLAEARRCVGVLAGALAPGQRAQVLEDLRMLADADGTVTPEERAFIDDAAAAFGVAS